MISDRSSAAPDRHFAWKIWVNPIFRRYCRARLRPRGLGIALLIVVMLAGFVFAISRTIALSQTELTRVDAERVPVIPLLVLQGLILFVLGTAQAAGGMTTERDEGVIDYQRLIPISPLAKVLGYLFGLPVREYVLVLATFPFTAWALWRGDVAAEFWFPLYAVLITSTLLYHFTGLVTGTVVKNRRWAFLVSIGLVFALYTVIPQMSRFGLVFFKYLTITPVFKESLPGLLPREIGDLVEAGQRLVPTVKFFNLNFSETVFTLFSQGGLILTFVMMLCRKWKRNEAHLLGKLWALLFFVWVQVLLLGNALPLVEPGNLFPSRELNRVARIAIGWSPQPWEAVAMSAAYGLVTLVLLFVLTVIITPSPERQVRGWRRARKQGETSLGFLSDAATGFWFVLVMALAGAAGWYWFTRGVVESRWFPGHQVPMEVLGCFAAVMVAVGLAYHALMETKGGRAVGLATLVVGIAPLMIAAVMAVSDERLRPGAVWLAGISPLTLPMYGPLGILTLSELPESVARAVPRAFYFWLMVYGLITLWLTGRLKTVRKARAESGLAGGTGGEGATAPPGVFPETPIDSGETTSS